MIKIMSFGHIPSWAGGRQESGLSNVIYQLAKHESELSGVEVTLVATDSFVPFRKDNRLTIVGWTKASLLVYILQHPIRAIKSFATLVGLKKDYPLKERLLNLFTKRIFLDKALRSVCPQVLHLHGANSIWYIDLVPENTKVIVTFHGMTGFDSNVEQHEVLYRMEKDVFLSERVDEVFFISTQLVSDFKIAYGDNGKKNRVIFNSYDKKHFYYKEEDYHSHPFKNETAPLHKGISLFTVASLSELKGQFRVLKALAALPKNERFCYYCIGGDSSGLASQLGEYAKQKRISFEYLGKMPPPRIREALRNADFMIMPSSSEGFGLSYLESIACGVPVILPRTLPIAKEKNLINDKNSILLDDCSVTSIIAVLKHIEDYVFDKKGVASSIAGLSWQQVACQYVKAFEELL